MKIDSVLPRFSYSQPLGYNYADSVYSASIEYPEFIDMSEGDIRRYQAITEATLPNLPEPECIVGVSRKQGTLHVSFVPLVFRNGKFQKLVSFKLKVTAKVGKKATTPLTRAGASTPYAAHSVLASGSWAKIRIPSTGIYQLTESLIRKAGFSSLDKVRVYGYGGALQPEQLATDYLAETDDLQEVPLCQAGNRRLFYGVGPVTWENNTTTDRTRNPYSSYGYYFLTEVQDEEPQLLDSAAFVSSFYPSPDDYHSLYEVDDFAWYHGGRNLYDSRLITSQTSYEYALTPSGTTGLLTIALSYDGPFQLNVLVGDSVIGSIASTTTLPSYNLALSGKWNFNISSSLLAGKPVSLRYVSGGNIRLDYVSGQFNEPRPAPVLTASTIPQPEFVGRIDQQDHHADEAVDMLILIPASQKLLSQAQRLKAYHEEHDSMRIRIIPADELFNEFSSGTPDANAYRRYLKMLYDRAETEADQPRYLVLFGDGAWDNRMLSAAWHNYSPDDFLLCFESEESFSETKCYVSDDFYCMLDEGEGIDLKVKDKADVAVGRFPVRTEAEAQIMVDKTLDYMENGHAGVWQNTICMMGDDGNSASDQNEHMSTADEIAQMIQNTYSGYNIKKVYWDAFTRTTSSTGNAYPEVTRLLKQQMQSGALIMNYSGHGSPYMLSHEQVLVLSDFAESTSLRLPLWITASCDIMPFDSQEENIGETAVLNKNGGAVAFYGTTRTVYTSSNRVMNLAYTRHVLNTVNGQRVSVGEAARLAKNGISENTENKLHYALLGDPALILAAPTLQVVIDSVNGKAGYLLNNVLSAGSTVTVKGHVQSDEPFNGIVTSIVRDAQESIVCRMNNPILEKAFVYNDRPNTIYSGSDSIRNGQFVFTFAVPKDIKYSSSTGQMTVYALSNDKQLEGHGQNTHFVLSADSLTANDGIGPSIYCYLNSPSFVNGGNVNTTPYFYAELNDRDGLNASGSSIGHDLQLVIDGSMTMTYNLNDYFVFDFGDYRSGSVGYTLPRLAEGPHTLQFRAWDILNNSSTAELSFNVVKGLEPTLFNVECTKNPATTSTTFVVTHDRTGAQVDIELDVFDTSGRQLWKHTETGLSSDNTFTLDWDLTIDGGRRLQTGIYLYRVCISCDGSRQVSKAKKLIVLSNK